MESTLQVSKQPAQPESHHNMSLSESVVANILSKMSTQIEEAKEQYIGEASRLATIHAISGEFPYSGLIKNTVTSTPLTNFKNLAKAYGITPKDVGMVTSTTTAKEMFSREPKDEGYEDAIKPTWLKRSVGQLFHGMSEETKEKWNAVYEEYPLCFKFADVPINTSIHASGVIISKTPLNMPVDTAGALPFNGKSLEKMGFIKYDMLSIDTLNLLQYVEQCSGDKIDWEDTNDEAVWECLRRGETRHVFQFSSVPMTHLLIDGHVTDIDSASEVTAIWRPGAIQIGVPKKWVAIRRYNLGLSDTLDVDWTPESAACAMLLKQIYGKQHTGLILYQEEVMALCQHGANFTPNEADDIRRAMGKKDRDLMASMKDQFCSRWHALWLAVKQDGIKRNSDGGTVALDLNAVVALCDEHPKEGNGICAVPVNPENVWKDFEGFSGYAFNKSHATAYTLISYQTARAWVYHPELVIEYECNWGSEEHRRWALTSARELGWKLVFPSWGSNLEVYEAYGSRDKGGVVFIPPVERTSKNLLTAICDLKTTRAVAAGLFDNATTDRTGLINLGKKLRLKSIREELEDRLDSDGLMNDDITLEKIIEYLPKLRSVKSVETNDSGDVTITFIIRGRESKVGLKLKNEDNVRNVILSRVKLYGHLGDAWHLSLYPNLDDAPKIVSNCVTKYLRSNENYPKLEFPKKAVDDQMVDVLCNVIFLSLTTDKVWYHGKSSDVTTAKFLFGDGVREFKMYPGPRGLVWKGLKPGDRAKIFMSPTAMFHNGLRDVDYSIKTGKGTVLTRNGSKYEVPGRYNYYINMY